MSENWELEGDLCRCCHAEGVFINLTKPRELNGITEIYSNMLKACFKIGIESVTGPLHNMINKICESCVLRLRDAYDFMKQVENCENKFKDYYNRNAIKIKESKNDEDIKDDEQDSLTGTDDDGVVPIKVEEDEFFTELKNFSLEDDNYLDLEHEDLINTATKQKDKSKITKKEKKDKEVSKVINKLKKANKKKIKKVQDTSEDNDDEILALINFTSIRDENGTFVHSCNVCKKNYATKGAFTKHYRQIHLKLRKERLSCHLCDEKITKYTKAHHLESKHGIAAPTCNVCGKKFAFPYEVITHQRYQHMGEKRFRCEECSKCFGSKLLLKNHLVSHSTTRDYICNICGKAFKTEVARSTHVKIHDKNKPHICNICDKGFKTETALQLHVRIHLNIRPHVCHICNKAYTEPGSLRVHIRRKH